MVCGIDESDTAVEVPETTEYYNKLYNVIGIKNGAIRNCGRMHAFYGKFASSDNRCLIVDGKIKAFAPSGLTEYTIPDSVTSIEDGVFTRCSSLHAFYGKFASSDNRCLIVDGSIQAFAPSGLTEYTIPDCVTEIGSSVFDGCVNLASIAIPDGVTSIGWFAFRGCRGLTKITIPSSVTYIGWYAFDGCTNIKSVTIPNSVTRIGSAAFKDCSSLTSVVINNPKDKVRIDPGAFPGGVTIKYVEELHPMVEEPKPKKNGFWARIWARLFGK